jgi:hypothetical protein
VADNNHQLPREEIGWTEMVKTMADIRDIVPLEKRSCLGNLAGNYGEAGAINVYDPAYVLPHVCTRLVGVAAFSVSFRGSSPVPSKWYYLIPPTSG